MKINIQPFGPLLPGLLRLKYDVVNTRRPPECVYRDQESEENKKGSTCRDLILVDVEGPAA